jgi:hypothetical protein
MDTHHTLYRIEVLFNPLQNISFKTEFRTAYSLFHIRVVAKRALLRGRCNNDTVVKAYEDTGGTEIIRPHS